MKKKKVTYPPNPYKKLGPMSIMKKKGVIKVRHDIHEVKEKDREKRKRPNEGGREKKKLAKGFYHTSFPERTF